MLNDQSVQKHNRVCLLLDYYGSLLTKRRQDIIRMSYEEDMSLTEIADILSITRQAVHDNMQQGIAQLEDFEQKIGMAGRDLKLKKHLAAMLEKISASNSEKIKEDLLALQDILV